MQVDLHNLDAVKEFSKDNRASIFEYLLGEKRSYLVFISSGIFKIFELPPKKEIEKAISGYIRFISDPEVSKEKGIEAAERLYKMLMSPAENHIPISTKNIIIVPDGILYYLPFETLIGGGSASKKSQYLIEKYEISYAPSVSSLMYLCQKEKIKTYRKELLAFGAPYVSKDVLRRSDETISPDKIMLDIYERNGFSLVALTHSRGEIKEISKNIARERKDVFLGKDVSERKIRSLDLSDYRTIHFACHAISDENYPLRSALVLSIDESDQDDGFFQVLEMYDIKMAANLVVLSACQTAIGRNIIFEGIFNLPRMFLYTGSRSTISTLWSINDKATSVFMKSFYKY
jgi:CHAT domain-containing protein